MNNFTKNKRNFKINIVHVVSTLGIGGMENGIINLCNRLDRNKFRPMVCCLKFKGEMAKRLRQDIPTFSMGLGEGKPLFHPIKIARFFKKIRPDIVHTHGLAGGSYVGIFGAKLAGVSFIINGEHGTFYTKSHQVLLQKILAAMSDITLSVSESLKTRIVENLGIAEEKIFVIPNGVDTEIFSGRIVNSDLRKEIEKEHGIIIDNESVVIACVGSLKPEKNQIILLKAFSEIKKQKPDTRIRVLLIGDGIDRADLEQYVTLNGLMDTVAFLGKRNDVPQILSITDILVSTSISRHEGMSNVILEAFASQVPVVATKSVGMDELIEDGKNGFLIDQNDIKDLIQKIEPLSGNPHLRESMGVNGRSFVQENHSISKMVEEYEQLYLQFADGRKH